MSIYCVMEEKLLKKATMTSAQAKSLLKKHGKNKIDMHQKSYLLMFVGQFFNPMILLLAIAATISWFTDSHTEALTIVAIIILNTLMGFIQEFRSNNIFKRLSQLISADVEVIRDRKKVLIPKSELVPGDYVFLKLGAIVPADCFVVSEENAMIDESSLTGESMLINKVVNSKEDPDMKTGVIFAGTNIKSGEIVGKVFATGAHSSFGKTARITLETRHLTEYEQDLRTLSRDIIAIAFACVVLIFVLNNIFSTGKDFNELILFTLAIAITVIPESLPAIATITLSICAMRLSKKGAVVKKLDSIESLGNVDVICTDKTGTLTENTLRLIKTDINPKYKKDYLNYCHLISSQSNDPFDIAISEMLEIADFKAPKTFPEYSEVPFDPFKKESSREFSDFRLIKGAPEILYKQTGYHGSKSIDLNTETDKGYRVIGLALERNKKTEYIGTLFFYDPIKPDVAQTLKMAEKHGISVKIITGDSYGISKFVANEVGLTSDSSEIVEADKLMFSEPRILEQQVLKFKVFCRADPIQKYKIIEALQANATIAYLGDGINDAPSLKLADVGIVVNNASDIAKSAADVILLHKNLNTLVSAVIEGRKGFENIEKYLLQTLSGNFGNFVTIGVLSLFLNFLPMLPIQILLLNLFTDIASLSFSFDNVDSETIKKPMHHNLDNFLKFCFVLGIGSAVIDIVYFVWANGRLPEGEIQTLWFITSGLTEVWVFFSLRTKRLFINSKPHLFMIIAVAFASVSMLVITLIGIPGMSLTTLNLSYMPLILAIPLVYFMVLEFMKCKLLKYFKL